MINSSKTVAFSLLLVALVIGSTPLSAAEAPAWLSELVGTSITLRPSVNANPIIYCPAGDGYCTLTLKGDIYPLMGPEHASIRKVYWYPDKGSIGLNVETDLNSKGSFTFAPPLNRPELLTRERFRFLLNLVTNDPDTKLYVASASSGVLHYRGSNHVGAIPDPIDFADEETARNAGYTLCPSCFAPIHNLPDFQKELALGQQIAAEVRSSHPAVLDDRLQAQVDSVGHAVLEHWPQPLRGYSYRFTLVGDLNPNAVACPGGWIFINDSLMELCESPVELEAILAHEIAHVEMRHGLRELRHAESAAVKGAIFGAILGGLASSKGDQGSAQAISGAVTLLAAIATQVAIAGYSRDMEMEADAFALNYLAQNHGPDSRKALSVVLSKMEYFQGCQFQKQIGKGDSFSSHPTLATRSDFTRNARIEFFASPLAFALEKDGVIAGTLQILGLVQSVYRAHDFVIDESSQLAEFTAVDNNQGQMINETRIFATLKGGHALQKNSEFKDMKVAFDDLVLKFDNKEDTKLYPDTSISMVLINRQRGQDFLPSLRPTAVDFDLKTRKAKKNTGNEF